MSGWSRIGWILTLRCESASELLSRRLDEPLGLAERLAVHGHLLSCRHCRRFRRQLRFLGAALSHHAHDTSRDDTLSPEARTRIAGVLREASQEPGGPADVGDAGS
jgi:predicted anti-sigma-YlaC factor YlaD